MAADGLPNPAISSPPPGLVIIDRYEERPGYSVNRPCGADSWLVTWTTSGHGQLRQGQTAVQAGAGDLVVLGPGVPHDYRVAPAAQHWTFWWAHCQVRPGWLTWLQPHSQGDLVYAVTDVPDSVRDRIENTFHRMVASARWTGATAPPEPEPARAVSRATVAHNRAARELAHCAMEEIILLAAVTAGAARPETSVDARVRRAQALIAADPGAPHTVRSLAASVSISPSRLAHLFTEQLGQTPMQALRDARLVHATRLLQATELPVERVAVASGFPSPAHFSRVFRQHYGIAPGAFRRKPFDGYPARLRSMTTAHKT